jgi:hypothetical protein
MITRTKGFMLVDLLVVIVCIAILVAIPACLTKRVEQAHRMAQIAACRANLKGIGTAFAMYRGDDAKTRFPVLFDVGQPEANIEATHTARDIAGLKTKLVGSEAAMQNVWLLIDKGLITEDAFACPSDKDYVPREFTDAADRRNRKVGWWSSAQFSYGMHFPYKSTIVEGERVDNASPLGLRMRGSFVVGADKNPSQNNEPATGVGLGKAPSNHGDLGEGFLMYSGQVDWKEGDLNSLVNGDDIYTIDPQDNSDPATPANVEDQYIVRHPALP